MGDRMDRKKTYRNKTSTYWHFSIISL
jgi:hypothetical protein